MLWESGRVCGVLVETSWLGVETGVVCGIFVRTTRFFGSRCGICRFNRRTSYGSYGIRPDCAGGLIEQLWRQICGFKFEMEGWAKEEGLFS